VAAIALALAAAAFYGVSNFVGPLLTRELPVVPVLVVGQVVAFAVSVTAVAIGSDPVPDSGALVAALIAGAGNALGVAGFYRAAELAPLSIVAPIAATAAVLPVALGIATGDPLVAAQIAGIVLAVAGVAAASARQGAGAGSDREPTRPAGGSGERSPRTRAGIVFALLAALGFGVFLTGMGPASDGGVFWAVALSRASLLLILVGGAALGGLEQRVPAAALPKAAIPGVLLFAGTVAYSFATQEGLLSIVSVLGSLFPVVTVALALVILRERLAWVQWVGVAATLVGVVLISTPL
jgi:drug/metabolite transporter (DMT)-like permease